MNTSRKLIFPFMFLTSGNKNVELLLIISFFCFVSQVEGLQQDNSITANMYKRGMHKKDIEKSPARSVSGVKNQKNLLIKFQIKTNRFFVIHGEISFFFFL